MRALLLLSIGVLSVWAVLYFFPRDEVQGGPGPAGVGGGDDAPDGPTVPAHVAGEGGVPGGPGPGTPAGPGGPADPGGAPTPAPAPTPTPAPAPAPPGPATAGLDPDPVALGEALLHGGPREVEAALERAGVEAGHPRGDLALAFAEAVAPNGDRRRAAELAAPLWDAPGNGALDLALLARSLGRATTGTLPAASAVEGPVTRAMTMRLWAGEVPLRLDRGEFAEAAVLLSDLLRAELAAPWEVSREHMLAWSRDLRRAQREHRWNPRGTWPGVEVEVRGGDTLVAIRKRTIADHPGLVVCTGLIERANRKVGRYIQEGESLRVPTARVSVLVDLSARWLLYLHDGEVVEAWEVGVGAEGHETYLGAFQVMNKQEEPMWFPGAGREPVPFGDPENPLGTRWMGWKDDEGRTTSLGFHGTDEPDTMGQAVSQGCIRMRNEDVEVLFEILPIDAPITVQP